MKLNHYLLLSLACIGSMTACKHEQEVVTPDSPTMPIEQPQQGTVREKGIPTGTSVQKTIGPEGGTLTSGDGKLTLTVPAGSVNKATNFSIQPITNTLPLSPEQSFRLLPEGQPFDKPVTLRFHYEADSLNGTAAQLLFMAYQGSDGIWKFLPKTKLNENAQTLTVETKHFSDWGVFAEFHIENPQWQVKPGGKETFTLVGPSFLPPLGDLSKDYQELAINDVRVLSDPNTIQNWKATSGTLKPAASKQNADYTAPDKAPAINPVEITVEVLNFIPAGFDSGETGRGKAILKGRLWVVEDTYFAIETANGSTSLSTIHQAYLLGNQLSLVGSIGGSYLSFFLEGYSGKEGVYTFDGERKSGTATAYYTTSGTMEQYASFYGSCVGQGYVNSGGNVTITEVIREANGNREYIIGRFSVDVFIPEGPCPFTLKKKHITGRFRLTDSY